MNHFSSITKVFSLVIQEEKQQEIGSSVNIESSNTFVVKNDFDFKSNKDRPMCAHCEIISHVKNQCHRLTGYPSKQEDQIFFSFC